MTLLYRILADLVVVAHMAYVLVVVFGLPIIWVGNLLGHRWVRNFWIRAGHLSMILIVVAEALLGITCPLTVWEQMLRDKAGQETYEGAFIGNLVHDWLFYDLPLWVFAMIYAAFGLLVLATFIMIPPNSPWKRASARVPDRP